MSIGANLATTSLTLSPSIENIALVSDTSKKSVCSKLKDSLRRFKDEVKDVQSGQECGMAFEAYDDLKEKDIIEIFTTEKISRKLQ